MSLKLFQQLTLFSFIAFWVCILGFAYLTPSDSVEGIQAERSELVELAPKEASVIEPEIPPFE